MKEKKLQSLLAACLLQSTKYYFFGYPSEERIYKKFIMKVERIHEVSSYSIK